MMKKIKIKNFLAVFALSLGFFGCSSSEGILGSGDLVTVSGTVINIDTFNPAVGVRVYLIDHETDFNTVTDDLGAFSIDIPVGTEFVLVTDDLDSTTNDWFPTANIEIFKPKIDASFSGYQIHACPDVNGAQGWNSVLDDQIGMDSVYVANLSMNPFEATTPKGTLAIWNNYIDNVSSDTLFPEVTSLATSAIISSAVYNYSDSISNEVASFSRASFNAPNIKYTIDKSDTFGPIIYTDATKYSETAVANTALTGIQCAKGYQNSVSFESNGNDLVNATAESTTTTGTVLSFGKPSFAEDSVNLTLENMDTNISVSGLPKTVKVRVRPGMISLILWGFVSENNDSNFEAVGFLDVITPVAAATSNIFTMFGLCG